VNDYRQVYASVLRDHLGLDAAQTSAILGRNFDTLPIFRSSVTAVEEELTAILEQNFPNPFIDSTTIRYSLATAQNARLSLFDMQGRELRVLRDGRHPAGQHSLTVNGAGLAPGLYLYALQTDAGRQVLRLAKA
jgi:hypothetical protein